jgi:hypothetical protein
MSLPVPEIVSRVSDPSNQSVVANINGAEMEMENVGDMYISARSLLSISPGMSTSEEKTS